MRTLTRIVAIVAVVAMVAPASGHAQFGSLGSKIKKRVMKGGTPAAEEGSPDAPTYDNQMLKITPAVLGQLAKGLAAETSERDAVAKELAAMPTPQQYQQCATAVALSDDGAKWRQQMSQDAQHAQQHMAEFQALVTKKCGHDPGDNAYKQQLQARPAAAGIKASGLTTQQYAMVKERVVPFCHAKGGKTFQNGVHNADGYLYGADEADALAPRCDDLSKQLDATM